MKKLLLLLAVIAAGCTARVVLIAETRDAVNGKIELKKETSDATPTPTVAPALGLYTR